MKKSAYYVPVAVHESAKVKALALVGEGYIQAHETIECSICSVKYLFLCDKRDSGRTQAATQKHREAISYFTGRIRESHQNGHFEDVLVLPYEFHMTSSSSTETNIQPQPKTAGRKAS